MNGSDGDPAACTDGSGTDCQQVLAELEAYLDGELDDTGLSRIRVHLAACYPCTDRADFLEQLRAVLRRGCVTNAPPSLVARIESLLHGSASPDRG